MSHSLLEYRGRQPIRADGKARREALLEATLSIIISDGIRGVRHRAVADLANVPLAATTYYFDDIFDLIHDAFVYYSEKILKDTNALETKATELLKHVSPDTPREVLIKSLAKFTYDYLIEQTKKSEFRLFEQTFRAQAMREKEMADMLSTLEQRHLNSIMKVFSQFNIPEVRTRARMFFNTIIRMEFELVAKISSEEDAEKHVYEVLKVLLTPYQTIETN